ncbi:hypothetical protein HK097_000522, partial [Rhizophlyctis rosea]
MPPTPYNILLHRIRSALHNTRIPTAKPLKCPHTLPLRLLHTPPPYNPSAELIHLRKLLRADGKVEEIWVAFQKVMTNPKTLRSLDGPDEIHLFKSTFQTADNTVRNERYRAIIGSFHLANRPITPHLYFWTFKALANRLSEADDLLQTLVNSKAFLDDFCWHVVIDGYAKRGNYDKVHALCGMKLGTGRKLTPSNHADLIYTAVRTNQWWWVLKHLEDAHQEGLANGGMYNIVIRGFCRVGDLGSAEKVLNQAMERNVGLRPIAFEVLYEQYERRRQYDEADRVKEALREYKNLRKEREDGERKEDPSDTGESVSL